MIMAEQQTQKKNKKGKKKSEISDISTVISMDGDIKNPNVSNKLSQPEVRSITIKETVANDKQDADESSGKKKKKSKKKSKDLSKESFAENNNSESLLNFSENGIHLLNHPEISVTITDSSQPEDNQIKSVDEKDLPLDKEKQTGNNAIVAAAPDATNTSKKKKKKKKKNSNDNLPVSSVTSNENTFTTPTYTKVVTSDNTCVLVVNNENFSVDAKLVDNEESRKNKIPEKSLNFSLPAEKQFSNVLLTKNFTTDTNMQFSNSVSIFPVLTNENESIPEPQIKTTVNLETGVNETKMVETSAKEEVLDESKPSKSQLKAERRAKQEAQRAAKLAKTNQKVDHNVTSNENKNVSLKEKTLPKESGSKTNAVTSEALPAKLSVNKEYFHKGKLFSHLSQFKKFNVNTKIHPAILEIGFQYNNGYICGSNARCISLLEALVEVIKDYTPKPDRSFCRDLESNIQSYLNFLSNCRPLSVSMMNAVKTLKREINQIPSDIEIEEIKERLSDFIYNFVRVDILLAKETIAKQASYKIIDEDVILVLGFSSVVRDILSLAHDKKKAFRVIIVDTRPKHEGLKMLRYLVKHGLQCSYISITGVSYIMKEVTKVFIGAHSLLANGCVLSRLGNKQIALVASTYSVPVYVCCETYKFCERVLTDSFVHNELGDPHDITTSVISNDNLKNCHDLPLLQSLNLLYDLTTPNLISEVITEKSKQPPSAESSASRIKFVRNPNLTS